MTLDSQCRFVCEGGPQPAVAAPRVTLAVGPDREHVMKKKLIIFGVVVVVLVGRSNGVLRSSFSNGRLSYLIDSAWVVLFLQ